MVSGRKNASPVFRICTQVRSEGRLPPTPPKIKEFHALKLWIFTLEVWRLFQELTAEVLHKGLK
jgi:hypothetical protein